MEKKIIAVCQDPGAACAIAPAIIELEKRGTYDLLVIGYRYSQEVFRNKGISFTTFEELGMESAEAGQLSAFLDREKPSLLILGTSVVGDSLEKDLTLLAKEKNIRTLAVLDYWSNYWQRFSGTDGTGRLKYAPDFIAIMDDFAKEEMVREGFSEEKLIVTGQPYFDSIKDDYDNFTTEDRKRFLGSLGVDKDDLFVVFASQPIEKYRGAGSGKDDFLGFTEKVSRDVLIGALNGIKKKTGVKFSLFIKLHPKEDLNDYNMTRECDFPVFVNQEADPRQLIFSADIVTGITSVFMVEAMFARKPVISIQPDLIKKDYLFTNDLGLTEGVYRQEDLEPVLARVILDKKAGKPAEGKQDKYLHHPNAAENLLKLIDRVIGEK